MFLQTLYNNLIQSYEFIIQNCQFERMKGLNQYTLSVRRECLIKSIKNQQIEQFKSQKRRSMILAHNAYRQICQIKEKLQIYNIVHHEEQIATMLDLVKRNSNQPQYMIELKTANLLQNFIDSILGQNKRKPYLCVAELVQALIDLLYQLSIRNHIFFKYVENNLELLLFGLYRYPFYTQILYKIAQIMTFKEMGYIHYDTSRRNSHQDHGGILQLLEIYLMSQSYESHSSINSSLNQDKIIVEKGSKSWFQNAIKALQITFAVMVLSDTRGVFERETSLTYVLMEGLKISLFPQNNWIQTIETYQSQIQTRGQPMQFEYLDSFHDQTKNYEQNCLYFVSIILDVALIKESVMNPQELELYQQILHELLKEIDEVPIINETAVKIIKILYHQLVLEDEDLQKLSRGYPSLGGMIQQVIKDDISYS